MKGRKIEMQRELYLKTPLSGNGGTHLISSIVPAEPELLSLILMADCAKCSIFRWLKSTLNLNLK